MSLRLFASDFIGRSNIKIARVGLRKMSIPASVGDIACLNLRHISTTTRMPIPYHLRTHCGLHDSCQRSAWCPSSVEPIWASRANDSPHCSHVCLNRATQMAFTVRPDHATLHEQRTDAIYPWLNAAHYTRANHELARLSEGWLIAFVTPHFKWLPGFHWCTFKLKSHIATV